MDREEITEIARVQPILLNFGNEIMETPDWAAVEKVVAERYDVDIDRFDVTELTPLGRRVKRKSDGRTVLLAVQKEPGGAVNLYECIYE
ncbi:MAG: hypothetical protein ACE5JL_18940 [Dehalococcoidia bacterium]